MLKNRIYFYMRLYFSTKKVKFINIKANYLGPLYGG